MRPLSQELKDTKRMARIGIDIALMRLVLLDIVTVMTNVNNSMLNIRPKRDSIFRAQRQHLCT